MSYVQGKSKTQILDDMDATAQPGAQINEQQKAAILVRSTEDIQVALQEQARVTKKVNNALGQLNARIESLEETFKKSSASSGRVASALNWLTGALVLVGVAQVFLAYMK